MYHLALGLTGTPVEWGIRYTLVILFIQKDFNSGNMNLSSIYGVNEQKRASLISLTSVVFFLQQVDSLLYLLAQRIVWTSRFNFT